MPVEVVVLSLIVAWANAFFAVAACWVVLGRSWWFFRAATLCGLLLSLLTLRGEDYARAYNLYTPMALRAGLVVAALLLWSGLASVVHRWRSGKQRALAPITLRNVLLFILLAGVLFSTATGSYAFLAASDTYAYELPRSLLWTVVALAAIAAVVLPRWWLRPVPIIAAIYIAHEWLTSPFDPMSSSRPASWLAALIAALLTSWCLSLGRYAGLLDFSRLMWSITTASERASSPLRWAGCGFALLLFAPALFFIVALRVPPKPAIIELDTSASDRLLALTNRLGTFYVTDKTPTEIEQYVSENAAVIDDLTEAIHNAHTLSKPLFWSMQDIHMDLTMSWRRCMNSLDATSRVQEARGDIDQAYATLDTILLLSDKIVATQFLLDAMMASVAENIALKRYAALLPKLDEPRRERLRATLEQRVAQPLPIEPIVHTERLWSDVVSGWESRLETIVEAIAQNSEWDVANTVETLQSVRQAKFRLLLTMLELDTYRRLHGELPTDLSDLPCDPSTYADPFRSQPFIYRREGDTYSLYSVGHNLIDDGGKEGLDVGLFADLPVDSDLPDWPLDDALPAADAPPADEPVR